MDSQAMQDAQLRDTLRMYNALVARCFEKCVHNFSSETLLPKEESCVLRCADKYMKLQTRCGMKFQDYMQNQQQ